MMTWSKTLPLGKSASSDEVWIDNKSGKKYKVHVTYGKEVKIFDLKIREVADYSAVLKKVKNTCGIIFNGTHLKSVKRCLVCSTSSKNSETVFKVYGAAYLQCKVCSHVYLKKYVDNKYLFNYYSKSKTYQKTYAEEKNSKIRVESVAKPKALWAIAEYKRIFGKNPKSILDVGAGSGHFVKACREMGISADGIEISDVGRKFAKDYFGVDLISADFINHFKKFKNFDIITFWGVVEHVIQPVELLKAAKSAFAGEKGIVIAAVPHWGSFSTAVQKIFPKTIVRHLDPSGHISCFTDESIATAYRMAGLEIAGSWFYGMDAYELITQSAYSLKEKKLIQLLKPFINDLQFSLDNAALSDEIALVGKVGK